MNSETLRLLERLIIASGGVLSIWLGYRLFLIANIKAESSASFKSAAVNVTLTKVGPGVFFALFGAFIMHTGITNKVETQDRTSLVSITAPGDDVNSPINRLLAEIGKLPDGPQKNTLLSLVNQMRDVHFVGDLIPDKERDHPTILIYGKPTSG